MTRTKPQAYLAILRERAQSILAAVQRLEELGAEGEDDHFSNPLLRLNNADDALWSLVEWIEEGREDA